MTRLVLVALVLLAAVAEARDPAVVRQFRRSNPCPSTGKTTGACPGWVIDHAYPLCAGGKDNEWNLTWQDARQSFAKDRIERELCACLKRPK